MRIKAAVARQAGQDFSIEEVELDDPRDDEVLVRIVAAGLCHTDLVFRDQATDLGLPAVLGHEGAGVVERIGANVTSVAEGDHVLLTFRSCGACDRCDARHPAYCRALPVMNFTGTRVDGTKAIRDEGGAISSNFFGQSSLASHALAYETNLVKVPVDLPLATYAPLGCGVQTGAGSVMRSLACPSGSSIIVIGAGAVGLSAVMAAVIQGCDPIIVIEPREERRALAIELGASDTVNPNEQDVVAAVRALLPHGADHALDTSGNVRALEQSLQYLGSHGVLGLVGVPSSSDAALALPLAPAITFGLTVTGIIEGDSVPDEFIPELIQLHRDGRFPFDRLITTYPLDEINRAVAEQAEGACIKAVLLAEGPG